MNTNLLSAFHNNSKVMSVFEFLNRHIRFENGIWVRVKGHVMYASNLDRLLALLFWKYSLLERAERMFMEGCTREKMIAVDIGSNIGLHTLVMARKVGPRGKVFAFEPDPENYSLLKRNIDANGYENVVPIQKAISDHEGWASLYRNPGNSGDHRIFDSNDGREHIQIETVRLDSFLQNGRHVDIIKMDIQGSELQALNGMEGVLQENDKLIMICEFAPFLLRKCGSSPEAFLEKVVHYGFKIAYFDKKQMTCVTVSKERLLQSCNEKSYLNLFLSR